MLQLDRLCSKTMRIPTIIGLSVLIVLIFGALWFYFDLQEKTNAEKMQFRPQNVQFVNITPNSIGVIWETQTKSIGSIKFSQSNNLNNPIAKIEKLIKIPLTTPTYQTTDVRNILGEETRTTHLVSLKNLSPSTTYYYQIVDNDFSFPDKPLYFQTLSVSNQKTNPLNQPIRGTVIDQNSNAVTNAIVKLKVKGASPLANYTGKNGNFIITTEDLRSENLKNFYQIQNGTLATLTILYNDLSSEVLLKLGDTPELLPPIIIGRNFDFTNIEASSTAKPNFNLQKVNYDLNNDQVINSLDRAIVNQNLGPDPKNTNADFNKDGIVNGVDLELITNAIQ